MNTDTYFHHISLNVKSMQKSLEFYSKFFKFKKILQHKNDKMEVIHLKQNKGKFTLELIEKKYTRIRKNTQFHLSFHVKNFNDFLKKINRDKVKVEKGPLKIGKENIIIIFDPDGYQIEINDNLLEL